MKWRRSRGPDDAVRLRQEMVEQQIRRRGLRDELVLKAMLAVPRHLFVPAEWIGEAYGDHALPIGHGQTISQPYIVALMTSLLEPAPGVRVLEIGTGSGYQAAVLAACGARVWSIERIPELTEFARRNLAAAGYLERVRLRVADGSKGWPQEAPFDRVILTAGAPDLPEAVVDQLAAGGLIVAPLGSYGLQTIYRYRETAGRLEREAIEGARFVPLIESEVRSSAKEQGGKEEERKEP
ncbi:MAG: protein-L-isoaspartate(D-aspartate) O-methyltransferase [Gemmatimonadota bacterium]|jgi:protein-L-isoaspartate(D-aspartate) O-methyltransferase|nr:MAG: protein-L-isoaspartate(D-aspartate) O-methyltransferase [Gemmatimonadota bacterium]